MSKPVAGPVGDDAAVLHDDHAVARFEHLGQDVADEDRRAARADEAAGVGQKLGRAAGIERGGRLVEDDEARGVAVSGVEEGDRDLDHLAVRDRQVRGTRAGLDAVAGKNPVERSANPSRGAPPPARPGDPGKQHADVLDDREVRAERELLEDAAQTRGAHAGDARLRHRRAVDAQLSRIGRDPAVEQADQGRFAGAVVADEADAFPRPHGEIDAVQCPDRAERLRRPGHGDDRGGVVRGRVHGPVRVAGPVAVSSTTR